MKPQTLVALHLTSALIAADPSILNDESRWEDAISKALDLFDRADDITLQQKTDDYFLKP